MMDISFNQDTVFYVLVTVALVLASLMYLIPESPDVAEALLLHQSSIAPIRKPGQTAIYRSRLTAHGNALLSGLSISSVDAPRARDGSLGDIWEHAKGATIGRAVYQNGRYSFKQVHNLDKMVGALGQILAEWTNNGKSSVAIVLPTCLEAFTSVFAAVLNKVPVVLVPYQGIDDYQAHEALRLSNAKVVISTQDLVAKLKIYDESKVYVSTKGDLEGSNVYTWDSFAQGTVKSGVSPPKYVENADETPISLAWVGFDSKMTVTSYTNQNIVSAVAAQIAALPHSDQWKKDDVVLACNSTTSMFGLVLSFAALIQGSKLVFPLSIDRQLIDLVRDIQPTIIISDDRNSFAFVDMAKEIGWSHSIRLQMAMATLSRGSTPTGVVPHFRKSVRLVYTAHNTLEFKGLSSQQVNLLCALTGAKVVHALTSSVSAGAITQTHPSDHRVGDPEFVNYGAPLPSVELVLKDHGAYRAETRKGQVWVRGPSLPTTKEWANTGIIGTFGPDGTLKLYY